MANKTLTDVFKEIADGMRISSGGWGSSDSKYRPTEMGQSLFLRTNRGSINYNSSKLSLNGLYLGGKHSSQSQENQSWLPGKRWELRGCTFDSNIYAYDTTSLSLLDASGLLGLKVSYSIIKDLFKKNVTGGVYAIDSLQLEKSDLQNTTSLSDIICHTLNCDAYSTITGFNIMVGRDSSVPNGILHFNVGDATRYKNEEDIQTDLLSKLRLNLYEFHYSVDFQTPYGRNWEFPVKNFYLNGDNFFEVFFELMRSDAGVYSGDSDSVTFTATENNLTASFPSISTTGIEKLISFLSSNITEFPSSPLIKFKNFESVDFGGVTVSLDELSIFPEKMPLEIKSVYEEFLDTPIAEDVDENTLYGRDFLPDSSYLNWESSGSGSGSGSGSEE